MSSIYPSLEDMEMGKMIQAQMNEALGVPPTPYSNVNPSVPSGEMRSVTVTENTEIYPALSNYMGMELTDEMIAANMPEYLQQSTTQIQTYSSGRDNSVALVAPISGNNALSMRKDFIPNGIKELILCKDAKGKVGFRVRAVNNGVFVCLVVKDSPAALAGLRFGDQILKINDVVTAGYDLDKVIQVIKKSSVNNISVVIRDRPFERTMTLHKDSLGHLGFQFNNGKITTIILNSSAARNGLLTDHQILEINGQNCIGIKDKEITDMITKSGSVVVLTIAPSFIYDHMIKKLPTSLLKGMMDHSIPEL